MSELGKFDIGPADPVEDSRQLPVITSDDEAGFVTGADLGEEHPDNAFDPPEVPGEGDLERADDEPEPLPSEDELDSLVADLDPDDIDLAGFDLVDLGFTGLDPGDTAGTADPAATTGRSGGGQ